MTAKAQQRADAVLPSGLAAALASQYRFGQGLELRSQAMGVRD